MKEAKMSAADYEKNPDYRAGTIDDYILGCADSIRPRLVELRRILRASGPEMTEKISWRMPTFYYKGNVIHFAAFKNHIGLYPGAEAIVEFADRLAPYHTSKGAIQIPTGAAFDEKLIYDIVRFNIAKNSQET